ncbi:unnamed protein product, partial [Linum tenue]
HHVHRGHRLAAGVLRVGDGVADDVLQEDLKNAASLLVDQPADTLHSTPASKTANGRLGDALDVIAQHLAMTLGSSLSKPLASLAAPRHSCFGDRTRK